jgi:hypothetical protein
MPNAIERIPWVFQQHRVFIGEEPPPRGETGNFEILRSPGIALSLPPENKVPLLISFSPGKVKHQKGTLIGDYPAYPHAKVLRSQGWPPWQRR